MPEGHDSFDLCIQECLERELISQRTADSLKQLNGAGNKAKHEDWELKPKDGGSSA